MSFIKVHGLKLADGAWIENAIVESLASDLSGSSLTGSRTGRIYYNSDTELFMGVFDDGTGTKVVKPFALGGDLDSLQDNLASTEEGKGTDLIGYDGQTGANGLFSVAAGTLGDSVDAIVTKIDGVQLALNNLPDTYVNVTGDTMSGDLNMNGNIVTGLATPTADTDAANKLYVDSARLGLDAKGSCRLATTSVDGNIDIATGGLLTIDGVQTVAGDRVLLKNQTDASENGIYVAASGAWTRSTDMDEPYEVTANLFTFIGEGSTNGDTGWVLVTNDPIILGTDDLIFVQFSAAGQVQAGTALEKVGLVLNVKYDNNTITLDGNGALQVNTTVVTAPIQSELNTTQSGAGLNSDGTYSANTSTNYISGATSLKSADTLLDAAIKQVADDLAALGSGSLTDLQDEVDTLEGAIGSSIASDGSYVAHSGTNYIDGNTTITQDIIDLDTQAKTNADAIADVEQDLSTTTATLTASIATEAQTRADADEDLQTEINAIELGAGLSATGTYSADTTTNYVSAATSLKDADKKLDTAIKAVADDLAALGSGSLTDLQTEVNTIESSVGLGTDGTLSWTLTSPALSAATTIKAAIQAIDSEISSDNTTITNLQSEVDAVELGAGLNTNGTYSANTSSPTISAATSLKDADNKIATALETLQSNLTASVFTYQASADATQHVITHNLGSNFVECQVWVYDSETGKYHGDLVGITIDSNNQLTVDLTVARTIRAIVRK